MYYVKIIDLRINPSMEKHPELLGKTEPLGRLAEMLQRVISEQLGILPAEIELGLGHQAWMAPLIIEGNFFSRSKETNHALIKALEKEISQVDYLTPGRMIHLSMGVIFPPVKCFVIPDWSRYLYE